MGIPPRTSGQRTFRAPAPSLSCPASLAGAHTCRSLIFIYWLDWVALVIVNTFDSVLTCTFIHVHVVWHFHLRLPLTPRLFANVLFRFQVFEGFHVIFLKVISSLRISCSENTLISTLLKFLRFVLWPKVCPILVYVQWALDKNVHSPFVRWNVL